MKIVRGSSLFSFNQRSFPARFQRAIERTVNDLFGRVQSIEAILSHTVVGIIGSSVEKRDRGSLTW